MRNLRQLLVPRLLVWWFPVRRLPLPPWHNCPHWWVSILVDCFGFGCGWCRCFLQQLVVLRQVLPWRVASSFAVVGLAAAGFGALGSRASVWQLPDSGNVRCTIRTLEPTSVEKTTEPGAAKPDAGKPRVCPRRSRQTQQSTILIVN